MIAKRFGKDIADEFKQKVVSKAYRTGLDEAKLDVVQLIDAAPGAISPDQPVEVRFTVDVRPEFYFLDLDRLLLLARLGRLLLGLELVATVVEKLGDGWDGIRSDLDEVHARLLRQLKRLGDRHGAEIGALGVDHLDLGDADVLVDARPILGDGRRGSVGSANGGTLL